MIDINLTALSRAILAALSTDKWMTRAELARAMQRPRGTLHTYDLEQLKSLEAAGYIERQGTTRGLVMNVWQYRRVERKEGGA